MAVVALEYADHRGKGQGLTKTASNIVRSWVKNDTSTASFEIAADNPKAASILKTGNIIRIRETDVPTWVGLIEEYKKEGGVYQCNLKSAEWLLQKHITPQTVNVPAGTALNVAVEQLVAAGIYSAVGGTPLIMQPVRPMGFAVFKQWQYADVFEELKKLCDEFGIHFWVDASLNINVAAERGQDYRSTQLAHLRENRNFLDVVVTQSINEIVTAVVALGEGNDIAAKPKAGRRIPHPTIFRAEQIEAKGATTPEMAQVAADNYLRAHYYPRVTIEGRLTNNRAIWKYINIGNFVTIVLADGTKYQSIVEGMQLENDGTMRLVFTALNTTPLPTIMAWYP